MLFIFDMGGVVTTTFQMDELYRRLNMNSKEFMSVFSTLNMLSFVTGRIPALFFSSDASVERIDRVPQLIASGASP